MEDPPVAHGDGALLDRSKTGAVSRKRRKPGVAPQPHAALPIVILFIHALASGLDNVYT
jgi:hypothetical protein